MDNELHNCELLPPHRPEYHDRIVQAKKDNPNQQFIVSDGIVTMVDPEDFMRALECTTSIDQLEAEGREIGRKHG